VKKNIKKTAEAVKIKSPCNNTCKYDKTGMCIGCYRTKTEIVGWIDFSDDQKSEILQFIEKRKES
jgi:hypothetical protein